MLNEEGHFQCPSSQFVGKVRMTMNSNRAYKCPQEHSSTIASAISSAFFSRSETVMNSSGLCI